ncbi:hypothetical protein QTG54_005588 [Skeletonema marinoi]|uniref:Uncharacterized protein n=1 Tax=Skeletonema marinoi TaxID=267567 RepID=A0AAD8YCN6_9STRA|nr:hypothetical protein QTG54_005588 [Skeletonema marinoi]
MTAPNDSAVEKVDVGALIHREFQLRKAEAAAAAAAESKKTSTSKPYLNRPIIELKLKLGISVNDSQDNESMLVHNATLFRKGENQNLYYEKIERGKRWPKCSADRCTNLPRIRKEECVRSIGQVSHENYATKKGAQNGAVKGGVCWRHGAYRNK